MPKVDLRYIDAINPGDFFGAIPEGDYPVEVMDAKNRESKAGNEYLELTYKVTSPPEFAGKQLRESFSYESKNDTGIKIMKNAILAMGKPLVFEKPDVLIGGKMLVRVICEDSEVNEGKIYNKVNGHWSLKKAAPAPKLPPNNAAKPQKTNPSPPPAPKTDPAPAPEAEAEAEAEIEEEDLPPDGDLPF
jgi:hypothetical protein